MTQEITLYQFNFDYTMPYVSKKTIKVEKKDTVAKGKDGYLQVKLVDNYQNHHNGDWEDEYESGYETFEQAKKALIKRSKADAKKELDHIKALTKSLDSGNFRIV